MTNEEHKHDFVERLRTEAQSQFLQEERDELLQMYFWVQAQLNQCLVAMDRMGKHYNSLVVKHTQKNDELEKKENGPPPT